MSLITFDCESLQTAEPSLIREALNILMSRGILLDEDDNFIGSRAIESCLGTIESIFRGYGYESGKLITYSQYFGNHGQVYAVYDSDRLTKIDATEYVDEWVANYPR